MKRIYLLLTVCVVLSIGCEQKTTETTTVQTDETIQFDTLNQPGSMALAEPKILLGGQPVDTTKCYKLEDFKQRVTIDQLPDADSSDLEFIQIAGRRPTHQLKLKSVEDLNTFDAYNYLAQGGGVGSSAKELGSERMYVEYTYYKNGESKSVGQNFRFCKE